MSTGHKATDWKTWKVPFPSISPSPETLIHSVKCARKSDTKTIKGKRLTSQKYYNADDYDYDFGYDDDADSTF